MTPDLKQAFESSINQMAMYIYLGIAIGIIGGLVWKLKGWLLSLPFRLIKFLACYIAEQKGRIKSRTSREIKQTKRKISKVVDLVETTKDTVDKYSSLKK